MQSKTHGIATRLYVNAGMEIPLCYYFYLKGPLDLDKGLWKKSHDKNQVTCKHCIRIKAKDRWA